MPDSIKPYEAMGDFQGLLESKVKDVTTVKSFSACAVVYLVDYKFSSIAPSH